MSPTATPTDSTFIRRVVLRNYRSIAGCDVTLGPLTFLVGGERGGKEQFPRCPAVEASDSTQVIVTSHSPDLLDSKVISEGQLLSVVAREGQTEIAAIGEAGASALRDHLYTAGELLRMDQLRSDEAQRPPRQLELFEPLPGIP